MPTERTGVDIDAFKAFLDRSHPGTLVERMGIEVTQVEPGRVAGSMPVPGNTQPYGLLHGGASAVLAETLASIAAALHAGPDQIAVGVDLSCTHHRAVREGSVHGVATALHEGNSVACYDIRIRDDDGRAVCTARLTCAIRPTGARRVADHGAAHGIVEGS